MADSRRTYVAQYSQAEQEWHPSLTSHSWSDSLCEGDILLSCSTDTLQEERECQYQANTLEKALDYIVNKLHYIR